MLFLYTSSTKKRYIYQLVYVSKVVKVVDTKKILG